ncbi:Coagulation factor 5/8 type-like protein [Kamptonema sp. UHCC 0994]|uniref:Coagulation factor 5/8 type-like protein n=1 Tax=Kamptonema sp. UHCC 0994 TaxID=3031329 RepID=UPI0023B9A7AE|nr:Coagulation factor 5/8 type-like protein [Kamptonema sp. UHCC 0994]MDF0553499.1 Coagulation factor 5/8 type-like protein [Kamptonema sp. UHCC 0994]
MSLDHDFLLLPEGKVNYRDYAKYFHSPFGVKLHDDFIHYVNDTLKWVSTLNPDNPKEWQSYGLNLYGVTIINKQGAEVFHHVVESWAKLFSKAPAKLQLRGHWMLGIDEEGVENEGDYEQLEFDRDVVVKKLITLANYADKTWSGDFFILHLGI